MEVNNHKRKNMKILQAAKDNILNLVLKIQTFQSF